MSFSPAANIISGIASDKTESMFSDEFSIQGDIILSENQFTTPIFFGLRTATKALQACLISL
ncbi:hypothetical protein YC2023_046633 [Brassica napus]